MAPRRLLSLAAVAAATVACGPSFQAVYECDVHFEHCYALDQRPVSGDAKKDCWREWLHGYTYGQSRDRVEYAAMRFSALSLDAQLPSEDTASAKRVRSTAAPAPTSAFAPPPSLAEKLAAEPSAAPAASASHPRAGTAGAPGEECADGCVEYWKACRQS